MNMNVRGIQRNMKNVVKNYSDAQVKVREATSNDPWGPSSTLMSEIADLTYNVVAFSEIMQMIWKRLNDHGKNWRHVYKALVLLEYLIKTGSEKVAQQCKENIFAIQTLKDFQYIEENKDQGMNVREKSKALVALLKDDDKLRNERTRALKAKERFAQSVSYASDSNSLETIPKTSMSYQEGLGGLGDKPLSTEIESARPQTIGEEELQLQLALAMSKEEAEADEKVRKHDDIRLKLAISESQKRSAATENKKTSAVDDLLSLNNSVGGATGGSDPWGSSLNGSSGGALVGAVGGVSPLHSINDPWSSSIPEPDPMTPVNDPWNPTAGRSGSATNDPWQPSPPPNQIPAAVDDAWMAIDAKTGMGGLSPVLGTHGATASPETTASQIRKTPESFLGPNSNLVNLDALVSTKNAGSLSTGGNPFAGSTMGISNPFQAAKPAAPTINQLRNQGTFPTTSSSQLLANQSPFLASNTSTSLLTGSSSSSQAFPASFGAETHLSTNNFSVSSGSNPFSM